MPGRIDIGAPFPQKHGIAPTGAIAIAPPTHTLARTIAAALTGLAAVAAPACAGSPTHAIAMHGDPALPPSFPHFPSVNPEAPKGGRLTLGVLGSFDSLNPLIFRGIAPPGVLGYVYESLMARSDSEPFTLYGHIAERIDAPDDRASITFHLRPEARFSDGRPIAPEDVVFSHALLKEKSWPALRSHYAKVTKVEIVPPRGVKFSFAVGGDREIPLILGLMRVLPRHRVTADTFERTSLEPPVGSGPYVIDRVDPGRSIHYRRNPDWWARDLATARGRFNFDEVRYEYFRDTSTLFEAFRSGLIDLRIEDDPGRWAQAYRFPAVENGRIVKRELPIQLPAGMSALVFNSRRELFADRRVRQALALLFDAEWLNRSLYNGLYERTQSFFERSELSSIGRPADVRERALLAPFPGSVRADVMDGSYRLERTSGSGRNRESQEKALALLAEAGFALVDGRMLHTPTRRQLGLEFLAQTRTQERLVGSYARALEQVGIAMRLRTLDSSQYAQRIKAFDFDMVQANWLSSLSPGNEQLNRWGSRAADTPNSFNYAGIREPAVDAIIGELLAARTQADFVSSVRALDRVLISGDYVIPLFHLPRVWIAHRHELKSPATLPLAGIDVDSWWIEPVR